MSKFKFYKNCDYCGKKFGVNKKSEFEKRKYCSLQCSYDSPERRATLSEKAKKSYVKNQKNIEAFIKMARKNAYNKHQEWLDKKVLVNNGWAGQKNVVNITNREIEEYRQTHLVCEICGMPERSKNSNKVIKLAIDHDHRTGDFRGLLCKRCNRCMGWFDKYQDNISEYLG